MTTQPSAVDSPTDRVLQVIRANPGDRLIIRVSPARDMDQMVAAQEALAELNPEVKFTILATKHDAQPERGFIEEACEVYFTAMQVAMGESPHPWRRWADEFDSTKAVHRAAMTAVWEWMTNGG